MCVLWPRIWSTLVNMPCDLEKNVYSAVVGWMSLNVDQIKQIFADSLGLIVLFRAIPSLLIFCLPELLMTEKEVFISPNVLVDLSVSLCTPISFCLMLFDTQVFGSYTFRIVISPWRVDLLILYVMFLFISDSFSGSEVTLFEVNVATPAFF